MLDPNELARLYLCKICNQVPRHVVAAADGHFYCQECIQQRIDEAPPSLDIRSPATGELIDRTIIQPVTIQSLIDNLVSSGSVDKKYLKKWEESNVDEKQLSVRETIAMANNGSARHMAIMARWYIFGEQEGIESNENEAYKWCRQAAELDDVAGKAYLGYCLIHGIGVDKNRDEGFASLLDALSEGSDFAAYTLGCYNDKGVHGFKQDRKKAEKYLKKAKELAYKGGDDCVLTQSEMDDIERYLRSYGNSQDVKKYSTDSGRSSKEDINGDSSSIPSQINSRADHDTISTLTPHSNGKQV